MVNHRKNQVNKFALMDRWKLHDNYKQGVSHSRIVTRSQTAFQRIRNSESDLDLFANSTKHKPEGKPHLMEVLKGPYGSIQRTLITKSTASYLQRTDLLCEAIDEYKAGVASQAKPKTSHDVLDKASVDINHTEELTNAVGNDTPKPMSSDNLSIENEVESQQKTEDEKSEKE